MKRSWPTPENHLRTIGMMTADMTSRQVSVVFNCHHSMTVYLLQRFQGNGLIADSLRPGQPRVTTLDEGRHILLQYIRNHIVTARQIVEVNQRISSESPSYNHMGRLRVTNFKNRHPPIRGNNLDFAKWSIC